jgi:flavorubredoxin
MIVTKPQQGEYDRPIEIGKGVYWIGFHDVHSGLHCNPYLIVDYDEAVVIDGGSRPDFPTVMMKILQTGIAPQQIAALIYQHYDPDLCGSIPNFEDIIDRKDLIIVSDELSTDFIRHYAVSCRISNLEDMNDRHEFSSGRTLRFFKTPHAHSAGSFVTLDSETQILFTSDLFGSYGKHWDLFLRLPPECKACMDYSSCQRGETHCPIKDILRFHQQLMPSERALKYALERILEIPFTMLAPQHGSIVDDRVIAKFLFNLLISLDEVGIDGIIPKGYGFNFDKLEERFG